MIAAADAFEPLRSALEQAGIRFAVGGSWASAAFGEPRFTNNVDILVEFTAHNLELFLSELPATFYTDAWEAREALRRGRPFNAIYMPAPFKFDFFPADAFPLGAKELDRAIVLDSGLSNRPAPFVTPEDILLSKLHWYKAGGEVSEVQWRDIEGIVRARGTRLDRTYLGRGAADLGVSDLLERALPDIQNS